jgi:hypothetical protein
MKFIYYHEVEKMGNEERTKHIDVRLIKSRNMKRPKKQKYWDIEKSFRDFIWYILGKQITRVYRRRWEKNIKM